MPPRWFSTNFTTNLPAELIDIIAHQTTAGEPGSILDKKGLSACSLTCRYWAKVCRPLIFWKIVLRSREDVQTLGGFFDLPGTQLPELVQYVVIEENGEGSRGPPWMHLVSDMVAKLPRAHAIWLNLSGAKAAHNKTKPTTVTERPPQAHSAHAFLRLPKILPGIFSRFTSLELSNYTFHSFIDLMRLVWSMSTLKYLICVDVAWLECPEVRPLTVRPMSQLESVRYRGTSHKEVLMWLLASCKGSLAARVAKRSPALSPEEDQIMREVLKCIFTQEEAGPPETLWNLSLDSHVSGYRGDIRAFYDGDIGPGLTLVLFPDRRLLQGTPSDRTAPANFARISNIAIDIRVGDSRCMTVDEVKNLNWDALDEISSRLSSMRRLRIVVDGGRATSHKTFDKLAEAIRGRMKRLVEKNKVDIAGEYLVMKDEE